MGSLNKISAVCSWLLLSTVLSAVISTVFSTTVSAQIANPFGDEIKVSYSGMREIVTSEGTIKMKEFHAPGMQRMEMDGPSGPMVMINRSDKGVAWMLMPSMNMYMEVPATQFEQQTGGGAKVIEHTKVGSEVIDGHKVDKYKSIFEDAQGNRGGGYYWITKDGIPLKMDVIFKQGEDKHHMKMTLKGLVVEPQPASLFEIPEGYSGMPSMGGMKFPTGMSDGDKASTQGNSNDAPQKPPGLKSLLKGLY